MLNALWHFWVSWWRKALRMHQKPSQLLWTKLLFVKNSTRANTTSFGLNTYPLSPSSQNVNTEEHPHPLHPKKIIQDARTKIKSPCIPASSSSYKERQSWRRIWGWMVLISRSRGPHPTGNTPTNLSTTVSFYAKIHYPHTPTLTAGREPG